MKTESGARCMNSRCQGAAEEAGQKEAFPCSCGEKLVYQGLTQLGEPLYHCITCGRTTKM